MTIRKLIAHCKASGVATINDITIHYTNGKWFINGLECDHSELFNRLITVTNLVL